MKTFLFAAASAAALTLGVAAPANAASVVAADGSVKLFHADTADFNFSVFYDGFGGDNNAPLLPAVQLPGLSAQIDFTFLAALSTATSYVFDFDIYNQSSAASRLSVFGFNSTPNPSGVNAQGTFDTEVLSVGLGVPNLDGTIDVCFKDSGQTNNCNNGNNGVTQGGELLDGRLTLTFSNGGYGDIALNNFFVRYQSINIPHPLNEDVAVTSAIGRGTVGIVPEPATWAMMIGGFGLVGAAMRRKDRRATVLA